MFFDSFVVGSNEIPNIFHKNCQISVPVKVPEGYSVAAGEVSVEGFNNLEQDTKSRLLIEQFFGSEKGASDSFEFAGPLANNYSVPAKQEFSKRQWSPCGQNVLLRVRVEISLQPQRQNQSLSLIEKISVSELKWKRCQNRI